MKNSYSSRVAIVLGSALLIGIPTSVLLPGCGGGGGGSSTTVSQSYSVPVQLSASQNGTIKINVNGVKVDGTLVIPTATPIPQSRVTAAIPTLPAGEYTLLGNFLPPRGFGLNGEFPAPIGTVIISGQLPTATQTGSFSLSIDDQIIDGTIPIISPTATPAPTVTATPHSTSTPIPTNTPAATATPITVP